MYIPSDDAKGSVEVHDVIFTGNDLLCGPTEFLAKTFNVSQERVVALHAP